MYFPLSEWTPAFLLTLAVEAPIVWALLRRVEPDVVRLAVLFLVVNLATHLCIWYVLTQLFDPGSWTYAFVAEAWAIGAEALFYAAALRGLAPLRALAVAVLANVASFVVGRAVFAVWPDLL
jgi:hypothetical protein